ncbi:flavin reductase family protein [Streptomyces sp. NPDC012769]|uniref:flavin reductase family protein n=1 Tax=Streptomyces sp. NPDC012769 TaxID=3364848 RepID=UPI003686D8D1
MTVSPELRTRPTIPRPADVPAVGTPRTASPDLLRSVFRQHAAGVAVITAHGERPVGFTATSLNSVAAEPPMISFGVGTGSSSWPVLAEAEHIGVHILGEHQQELATTFARSGADRFAAPTRWRRGPEGVPVLDGVLAWLVCRVVARVPAGDHRIVIAEVVAGDPSAGDPSAGEPSAGDAGGEASRRGGRPLLYHQGRFNALRD